MKPENGYYTFIEQLDSGELIKVFGPYESMSKAEQVQKAVVGRLDLDLYFIDSVWFGPDIEPVDESAGMMI